MNAWSGVLGNISASDESLKKCLRFLRPNTGRRSGQFQSGIGIWQFGSSTHTRSLDYHHFFAFTQKKKKNRVAFRWIFNRRYDWIFFTSVNLAF
ncbi:hypothetical protein CICLE_v10023862mg [Citrus x clementina]|uniref:Uncharacterized protein n=1 Tax=Citrus clementina TaxID=85681 RepID=V4VQT6_CITCL|nr:hypothetical protein CICLE_v10023862mg [Citrus x clementina]